MQFTKIFALILALLLVLTACGTPQETEPTQIETVEPTTVTNTSVQTLDEGVQITLSDERILVDGEAADSDSTSAVYLANDIVYYEAGRDFTYGEGGAGDAHTAEDAAAHTVVHITRAGTYRLTGSLSKGQIAVDLGEDAKEDPDAVVTLVLDDIDITCEVAPAVIFYNVYECADADNPTKDVDTAAAGANVVIADGSENTVNGAYVARIYKPDSGVLNEDGTEVEDAKKLHKYDAAFYSKMTMNVGCEKEGSGILNIYAQNEGLDSEMHLTLNGGNIYISSGNDGINTNEDGVSVTTVNGGKLHILVTGETGEGDGIDSNGWLVINGGEVIAAACANSADAGIDSDMGIHINGGTVIASGHMLDHIEDGGQTYAVFTFSQTQSGSEKVSLKDNDGKVLLEHCPQNAYSVLVYSDADLKAGFHTLWSDGEQLAGQSGGTGMPGMRPDGMEPPEGFDGEPPAFDGMQPPEGFGGMQPPEGFGEGQPPFGEDQPSFAQGQPPEDWKPGEGETPFDGQQPPADRPEKPNGGKDREFGQMPAGELTAEFEIKEGGNLFNAVSTVKQDA